MGFVKYSETTLEVEKEKPEWLKDKKEAEEQEESTEKKDK